MNIGSETHVVCQVPPIVIRIFVDDDVVTIPVPTIAECKVCRRNAPIPSVEPESARTTASQMPSMRRTKPTSEASVFKGSINTIVAVIAASVMSHPAVAGIDVRRIWMTRSVTEITLLRLMRRAIRLFNIGRPVRRRCPGLAVSCGSARRRRRRSPMGLWELLGNPRQRHSQ